MTLELSVPYRMDESCNFRTLTLTPFSKISLTSQDRSQESVSPLLVWDSLPSQVPGTRGFVAVGERGLRTGGRQQRLRHSPPSRRVNRQVEHKQKRRRRVLLSDHLGLSVSALGLCLASGGTPDSSIQSVQPQAHR